MPNPRTPVEKAKITGAAIAHPGRHADRAEIASRPLGDPSRFLGESGKQAWWGFKRELPWLMESDRSLVEIAAMVRGRLLDGEEVGITALSMLQSILSKMGGTPADRSRVSAPSKDEHDEFFDD